MQDKLSQTSDTQALTAFKAIGTTILVLENKTMNDTN